MVTDPPPKIELGEALQIVSKVAGEQFEEFAGIYCVRAEVPMRGMPRPDGKVLVWRFYYRIPGNGRDAEAAEMGWHNIWGDGIIELYEDKTWRVTKMPKVIEGNPEPIHDGNADKPSGNDRTP